MWWLNFDSCLVQIKYFLSPPPCEKWISESLFEFTREFSQGRDLYQLCTILWLFIPPKAPNAIPGRTGDKSLAGGAICKNLPPPPFLFAKIFWWTQAFTLVPVSLPYSHRIITAHLKRYMHSGCSLYTWFECQNWTFLKGFHLTDSQPEYKPWSFQPAFLLNLT